MRKPKAISRSAKGAKIQVRLRPEQKAVLIRAAGLRRTSLSNFVLKHSIDAARQVLAEQTDIVLSPTEWRAFCVALDAPPRSITTLNKLVANPSVFDGA